MTQEDQSKKNGPHRPRWYVVQVTTGDEEGTCAAIERACEKHDEQCEDDRARVGLRECFCPMFARRRKRMGEWKDIQNKLLPGYVVADVQNATALAEVLRRMERFGRVLTSNETYSPLDEAERQWLETQTRPGERIVPLSFGCKEGDKLVVTEGPLAGNEAMIVELDRKNCIARVELHAGQMTLKTTVGLVIMPSGIARVV